MKELFDFLAKHGGKIVSTNDLNELEINQARASKRMYVDEDSLGYVWLPAFYGRFPDTINEVEMFEWCYPLDVKLPEEFTDWSRLKKSEDTIIQFLNVSQEVSSFICPTNKRELSIAEKHECLLRKLLDEKIN